MPLMEEVDAEELRRRLEEVIGRLLEMCAGRSKGAEVEVRVKALEAAQLELGRWMRQEVFREQVGTSFEVCRAGAGDKGLRVRFAWHEEDEGVLPLVALPWELLDDDAGGAFGRRRRFPVSRYLQADRPIHPLRLDKELRVLLVEANPNDVPAIDATSEKQRIREAIEGVEGVAVAEVEADLLAVRDAVLDRGIHVIHFMGHGGRNAETGEPWVTFCDAEGKANRHAADFVADRWKDLDTLRAVVLSSCYGGALPWGEGCSVYGGVAPALLRAEIPVVVAMQFAVSDSAAAAFAGRFYSRLVHGDAVDVAAAEARLEIEGLREPLGAAWIGPCPRSTPAWTIHASWCRGMPPCLSAPIGTGPGPTRVIPACP